VRIGEGSWRITSIVRAFTCGNCQDQLVFFENTSCLHCGSPLGYLPDESRVVALVETGEAGLLAAVERGRGVEGRRFRRCANADIAMCNWLVDSASSDLLCPSCALTRTRPSDSDPEGLLALRKAEAAKRRLIFQLTDIGLPVLSKHEDPERGLAFDLLSSRYGSVVTGHEDGVITLDLAESDDAYRERTRHELGEPYRTLLGHVRHETGHYYFDRLVAPTTWIDQFRQLFGDERASYAAAIERHYAQGAPAGWAQRYVSSYATMHPFEDWAETWAHYLHIHDTLQTADAVGLVVLGPRDDSVGHRDTSLSAVPSDDVTHDKSFEIVVGQWLPLTYALNAVNRSMGRDDLYPFVLPGAVIEKLSFVHRVIRASVGDERPDDDASRTLRMASSAFKERFVRMLVSKLRVVFETAARDIELWHQSATAQMEAQLRDRRRSFRKRRESLERIQQAAGDLEERVADVEAQSARIEALITDVTLRCETLAIIARRGPTGIESEHIEIPFDPPLSVSGL